jgi:D-alanyl-D-alanine carboxypeptidase
MKKCLALVLAVLMTMTLLTGCAQKAATSSAAASVQSASASAPAQSAASGAAQSPAGSSQSTAAESAPVTAGDEASLKARMNEIISDPEHPLAAAAIGVVKDGQIAFADAVGSKTIDNDDPSKNVPADGDTKYRIASISKLATAIAVWQLIEAGKIDPDKDASEYLGFTLRNPSYPDTPITVRMMMSHTSSIREDGDDAMYNIPLGHDVSEFFTPGKEYYCSGCWAPEGQAPGEYFSYANINYGLLGTIIERVSGERFDNYMTAHIFEPMGLSCSYNVARMDPDAQKQIGTLYRKYDANGDYDPANGKWTAQVDDFTDGYPTDDGLADYQIGTNATVFAPQGALRISVKELCAIMQMFCSKGTYNGKQILKPETIENMFTPVWTYDPEKENGDTYYDLMACYGMGPQIFTNQLGDRLVADQDLPFAGHTAEAYGLLGCIAFDREKGNGLIYIVAGTGSSPDDYFGSYSSFYGWEESLLTAGAEFAAFPY